MKHWVVVADAATCRIYATDEWMGDYTLLAERANERAHLDVADIQSDRRGATRAGPGLERSALDPRHDPRDLERQKWAREIADHLDRARGEGQWERIVVAAPPRLLGQLRAELSEATRRALVASIDKDLVKTPAHQLPEVIRAQLPT